MQHWRGPLPWCLALYALAIVASNSLLQSAGASSAVAFVLGVIVVLLFDPLRRRLQRPVDRLFFRERVDFAQAIHEKYPGKMLAYNCSPSFNWRRNLDLETIARQHRLAVSLVDSVNTDISRLPLWIWSGTFTDSGSNRLGVREVFPSIILTPT